MIKLFSRYRRPISSFLVKNHSKQISVHASAETSEFFDVLVVGAGMAGSATVSGIVNHPSLKHLKVGLVDSRPINSHADVAADVASTSTSLDPRVISMTPATVDFFKRLRVWDKIQASPFRSMQVWDFVGQGMVRFEAEEVGRAELGFIVENREVVSRLQESFQDCPNVHIISPSSVEAIQWPSQKAPGGTQGLADGLCRVQLEGGRKLSAKLLVAADGARSKVRQLAGIRTVGWGYSQSAVVSTVQLESATWTAFQRFLPEGPLAMLPGGDSSLAVIVWSTSPEKAAELARSPPEDFSEAANSAFRDHFPLNFPLGLGPIGQIFPPNFPSKFSESGTEEGFSFPPKIVRQAGRRYSFPLSLSHSERYIAPGLVLVGDSAHLVHPLAGQGANLGFGDVDSLVRKMGENVENGGDLGEGLYLGEYERERQRENLAMIAVLEGIRLGFRVQDGPLALARNLALSGVDSLGGFKSKMVNFAMGI